MVPALRSLVTLCIARACVQMAEAQHLHGVGLRDVPQSPGHFAQAAGRHPGLADTGRPAEVTCLVKPDYQSQD